MSRSRPSFFQVLAAPWRWMHAPRRAGAVLVGGTWYAVLASFAGGALMLAATGLGVRLFEGTLVEVQVVGATPDVVTVGGAPVVMVTSSGGTGPHYELQSRTAAEALRQFIRENGPAQAVPVALTGLFLLCAIVVGMTIAQWPIVHAGGSPGRSFIRTLAGVVASGGVVTPLVATWGFVYVTLYHTMLRARSQGPTQFIMPWVIGPSIGVAFTLAAVMLWWLGRAVMAAREGAEDGAPPLCEGCGYNLTHLPESGRCTECGLEVERSLTPGDPRCGVAWETAPGPRAFLNATIRIIGAPRRFYGELQLRTDEVPARRFAALQYALIGLGAYVWFFVAAAIETTGPRAVVTVALVPMIVGFGVPLAGWATHRAVAAVAMGYSFVRQVFPHPDYARKIVAYESAFLWLFCLHNGWIVSTGIYFGGAVGRIIGRTNIVGVPLYAILILGGNGLLILLWLRRYRTIVERVRWANY